MIGDIILVASNNIIGKLIRWYTKSEFNHVGLLVDNYNIVEATRFGVLCTPINQYIALQKKNKLKFKIYRVSDLNKEDALKVVKFAKKQVGKSYDFIQFICVACLYLWKKVRRIEPIDLSGWVCSELVAESFYEIGIVFSEEVDPDNITPKDIAQSNIILEI